MHGGTVTVSSVEGEGSTFWFTARFGVQPRTRAEPPTDLRDRRVLIVDDHADNREILTQRLRAWGLRPSEASNATEALRKLYDELETDTPFVAALLDLQLPGMDGVSLARALRADPRLNRLRLVLLPSLTLTNRTDCRDLGFDACLPKPIRQQDLRHLLERLFQADTQAPALPRAEPASPPAAPPSTPIPVTKRGRILLAEDNQINQMVALGQLKRMGVHADAVANGLEAIASLQRLPYDLVLMDVQMPELDGLEATRRIRAEHSEVLNPRVPIIAMTAHAMQGDREHCLAAGMDDYLTKPLQPKVLRATLEKWSSSSLNPSP
jgi:CheY-like chemotaxis protein